MKEGQFSRDKIVKLSKALRLQLSPELILAFTHHNDLIPDIIVTVWMPIRIFRLYFFSLLSLLIAASISKAIVTTLEHSFATSL